jgi:hypothetical protein
VVVPRAARLTSDMVVRALGVLGLAGINQALAKNPKAIGFVSPIHRDGPGWRAEIDYEAVRGGAGVKLGLWIPREFARFKRSRLGRLVRTWRCTRAMPTRTMPVPMSRWAAAGSPRKTMPSATATTGSR